VDSQEGTLCPYIRTMSLLSTLVLLTVVTANGEFWWEHVHRDVSRRRRKLGKCVVDGGEAASDLMDAALFIWGAKQRCGQEGMAIKCEIDIASAAQSIASTSNTILKIVGRCGSGDFEPDLARSIARLMKATSGLAAASGGIKQKCVANPPSGPCDAVTGQWSRRGPAKWAHGKQFLCVLDVKHSAKNLLRAIRYLIRIDKKCDYLRSGKCAKNSLKVVGALMALGEYLSASVGDCQAPSLMSHDAECAQEYLMLVHHLAKAAQAAAEIWPKPEHPTSQLPTVPATSTTTATATNGIQQVHYGPWAPDEMLGRLYLEDDSEEDEELIDDNFESSDNALLLRHTRAILVGLLPVVAVAGAVFGKREATRHLSQVLQHTALE